MTTISKTLFNYNKNQVTPISGDKSIATDTGANAEALADYLSKLDGTENAWDNVKTLLPQLFHPDFKLVSNDKEINYDDFVCLIRAFTKQRGIARLEQVQHTPEGLLIVVNNIVDGAGEAGSRTKQRVAYKDRKIVSCEAVAADRAKFGALIDHVSSFSKNDCAKGTFEVPEYAKHLADYLSKLDGTEYAWDNVKTLLPQLFHPDFKLVSNDKEINYDDFVRLIQAFTKQRGIARLEQVQHTPEGLLIVVNNIVDGAAEAGGRTKQRVVYKDRKIISCEAVTADRAKFGALLDHVSTFNKNNCTEGTFEVPKYAKPLADYLSKFDGTENAWDNVKTLLPQLFHPDFKLVSNDKEINYNDFVCLIQAFTKQRGIARLEQVQHTPDGLLIVVNNIVDGAAEAGGRTKQRVVYKDRKIISCEAIAADRAKFGALIDHVSSFNKNNCTEGTFEVPEYAKPLADYFSKLDGSENAWDNVKTVIPQVFHPNLRMITSEKELNYDEFVYLIETYSKNRCIAKLEHAQHTPHGLLVVISTNGESTKQLCVYQEGKIISFEGWEDSFVKSHQHETDPTFQLCKDFFSQFNGSNDAWTNAKPLLEKLYDRNLVIVAEGKHLNYEELNKFSESFAANGNIVDLEEVQRTPSGVRVVIRNIIDGRDDGLIEQFGTFKDGKIVHWEASPSHCGKLRELFDSCC